MHHDGALPPFLYVPCTAEVEHPEDAQLEYRRTRDGRTALLAYSALALLVGAAGLWAEDAAQAVITSAIAVGLAVQTWALWTLVLRRPRHDAEDLVCQPGSVKIPGSRRITAALLATAGVWAVAFAVVAAAAAPGWRIACLVIAALCLVGVLTQARRVRPRWLELTLDGFTAAGAAGLATLRWDEIREYSFRQGSGGIMVFRYMGVERRHHVDIESATLDPDPDLILMAIERYRRFPARRSELTKGTPPARLTDPRVILGEIDGSGDLAFGPERRRR